MLLFSLINGFILDCRSRNLSLKTIELYDSILHEVCDFLDNPQSETITTNDLRRFVVHSQERDRFSVGSHPFKKPDGVKLTAWTIHRYVRVLKTFFTWAVREEILSSNPAAKLKKPQLPKDEIKAFSEDEVKTLLETAKAQSYRDYVIVLLLLDSGLRKKELVNLTLDDVNLLTGIVTIRHGKGNKTRQVCIGKVCRKVLWLYVNEHRKPETETEKALFVNSKGQALNYFTLGTIMTRLSKKCGFRVYCHRCRHTYATSIARTTGNAFLLAQVLGHSDLETSKNYIHLAQGDIQSLSSPMDEMII